MKELQEELYALFLKIQYLKDISERAVEIESEMSMFGTIPLGRQTELIVLRQEINRLIQEL